MITKFQYQSLQVDTRLRRTKHLIELENPQSGSALHMVGLVDRVSKISANVISRDLKTASILMKRCKSKTMWNRTSNEVAWDAEETSTLMNERALGELSRLNTP
jgi:hypothetical protein